MSHQSAYHRIIRLKITGGFLSGLDIEFHKQFNTVIGPRGSGKSIVVESIRHCLNVMPGRDGDPLRGRAVSMIEEILVGGRVELTVEAKDGMTYTINRAAGEDAVILNSDGTPLPPGVSINHIFGAAVHSQGQIAAIAENPHYQLDLIDGFEVNDLAAVTRRIHEVKQQLEANSARILPLVAEMQNLEAALSQWDPIKQKLKTFDKQTGPAAEENRRAHSLKAARGRESMAILHCIENLKAFSSRLSPWLGRLSGFVKPMLSPEIMSGPNSEIVGNALNEALTSVYEVDGLLTRAVVLLDRAKDELGRKKASLDLLHIDQEDRFRAVIEKPHRNLAKSAERAQLEKQRNELLFCKLRQAEISAEITVLETRRTELCDKLTVVRDERFAIRKAVVERLNSKLNPQIRIGLAQCADQDDHRRFLESSLKDADIQHQRVAASLSREISPDELAELVRANDVAHLAQRGCISKQQATAVIRELAPMHRLLELQTVDLNDVPTIELCDQGNYKESGRLSTSQKCAAILPILLLEGDFPLIIDQPEDNLDNCFVRDTIIPALKSVKAMRQLILTTHNPSIPVLGGASRVIVMQSDGQSGRAKKTDSVNGCGEEIVTLFDGGQAAFNERSARKNP